MDDSFTEPPRRSTRRVLLESRRDYESQSPIYHHHPISSSSGASRKRKLSSSGSGGGGEGGGSEGGGEGERRWVRDERDRGDGGSVSYSKRSSNTLYATKHKRSRIHGNSGPVAMDTIEVPLRRSKREKRLLFSNLNQQEIYQHMINNGPHYPVMDFSEDELEPYEKILSPVRRRRRRPGHASPHCSPRHPHSSPHERSSPGSPRMRLRSSGLDQCVKAETIEGGERGEEEGGEEEGRGGGEGSQTPGEKGERDTVTATEEQEEEGEEEDKEMEEEEEEGEEGGRGYYLRKRRPVVYQYQPIIQVVEDDTPPKKRRQRVRTASGSDSAYYRKSGSTHHAPRAYGSKGQSSSAATIVSRRVRRVAHAHDSSSTSSSGSDSDEARFRRRKSRSMKKARLQCLPMNFDPSELSQPVIRDRQRIGASLADVDPMNINREVTFDSIGGLKQHIRSLKEMILFPLLYPEVFDRFRIQPPRGVLFFGPPGCGKTLVARGLANECSRDGRRVAFFMRKGADCLSKWVGESERQLRLLFDQAYQMRPSIIFFDEIDGLAPVRSTRQDQIHSSIVSTLLALMDGLDSRGEVVVIGATNRIDAIDPALRRPGRFDREFLFPLPSREDRSSIISIHTRHWSPPLKPSFVSQLADQTVGYCGADIKSLSTEAALSALRRTYPQIYDTGDKLVLDVTTINVTATDFFTSLGKIVPTARRSESSCALALPREVAPLLMRSLGAVLGLVEVVFNPSWRAVEKARRGLNAAFTVETQRARIMEEHVRRLTTDTTTHHNSRSITGLISFETGSTSLSSSRTASRQDSQCSMLSDVFERSQPSQNAVYFKMDDVVNEVGGVESITVETNDDSAETLSPSGEEDAPDNRQATTAEPRNLGTDNPGSILGSSLSSSHPHSLPVVHRPRLLLCGAPGGGQSSHLGPALLHILEEIPVKVLDLSVIFGVTSCCPEESLVQLFKEAKRTSPSIVYLPRIDSWWGVTTETFQATFTSSLLSLPPSTSLVVIATAECPWSELCPSLKKLFSFSCETYAVPRPGREERRRFFSDSLLVKPLLPPPTSPLTSTIMQHKQLPLAPPPKSRQLAPGELNKMDRQRDSVLRELRIFLREATNKLMAERKFKEFTRPVGPEEVPDYYDIIKEPMDLGTIMKKIDEHHYTLPRQWLGDVDKITENAVEYNPAHDSDSRLLLHRAAALQDMAHSILEHELSEDFEQQCEDIEDTYKKVGRRDTNQGTSQPLKTASSSCRGPSDHGDHTPSHAPSPSRSSTHSSRRGEGLYECRRRSLRVKGLEPEEKGFDYYSTSRTPRKLREREGEEEEEMGGEREEGERRKEGENEEEEEERGREVEERKGEEGEGEVAGDSEPLLESGYDDDEDEEDGRKSRDAPDTSTENSSALSKRRKRRKPNLSGVSRRDNTAGVSDDRMDTEESEEDSAEDAILLAGSSSRSGRHRHRSRGDTDMVDTPTDYKSASSGSTVVSIQRSIRRRARVKHRLFARNRASPTREERCNDDVIVVATTLGGRREEKDDREMQSQLHGDRTARNGVDYETNRNDLLSPPLDTDAGRVTASSSVSQKNRSLTSDDITAISRHKTAAIHQNEQFSAGSNAVTKRAKPLAISGDVISSSRGSGREVLCNGVGGTPADLWLGGGGGEGDECDVRDVLVDMETESSLPHGERDLNSKSTHSSATTNSRGQVSNSKSIPSTSTTTSRVSSLNSNPNSKSAPSIPTTITIEEDSGPLVSTQPPTEERLAAATRSEEVDIDAGSLLAVFRRVVDETEETSVEQMEKMLATFNHLVFRYRMRTDRRQLPKDLELAADLFLRQPQTPNIHD